MLEKQTEKKLGLHLKSPSLISIRCIRAMCTWQLLLGVIFTDYINISIFSKSGMIEEAPDFSLCTRLNSLNLTYNIMKARSMLKKKILSLIWLFLSEKTARLTEFSSIYPLIISISLDISLTMVLCKFFLNKIEESAYLITLCIGFSQRWD